MAAASAEPGDRLPAPVEYAAAVDRYHGMPPYPATRAYVARVIHEFNRRVRARDARPPEKSQAVPLRVPSP